MLARCQFSAKEDRCGATLTYPIRGYPWRNNVIKSYQFDLGQTAIDVLFADVHRIRKEHPDECLDHAELFNDANEKANGITRDRSTGTLCYSISIFLDHALAEQFSLREDSPALLQSTLFHVISRLIAPYERLSSSLPD